MLREIQLTFARMVVFSSSFSRDHWCFTSPEDTGRRAQRDAEGERVQESRVDGEGRDRRSAWDQRTRKEKSELSEGRWCLCTLNEHSSTELIWQSEHSNTRPRQLNEQTRACAQLFSRVNSEHCSQSNLYLVF